MNESRDGNIEEDSVLEAETPFVLDRPLQVKDLI